MKRAIGLIVVAMGALGLLSGCVQMGYTKTVTVYKNPRGEVTSIVETESITEPHSEMTHFESAPGKIPFENMK